MGGLSSRLQGVVARKSSVVGSRAKRRSSMTALALGRITEQDLDLDESESVDSSVAGGPVEWDGPTAKIWCGSWNVGAKEPFSGTQTGRSGDITKWAPSGYDVYVVGIQEGVSDRVYDTFAEVTGTRRMVITKSPSDHSDRVLGRGDGSFRRQKFTGIQAFVRPQAESFVKYVPWFTLLVGCLDSAVTVACGVHCFCVRAFGVVGVSPGSSPLLATPSVCLKVPRAE